MNNNNLLVGRRIGDEFKISFKNGLSFICKRKEDGRIFIKAEKGCKYVREPNLFKRTRKQALAIAHRVFSGSERENKKEKQPLLF